MDLPNDIDSLKDLVLVLLSRVSQVESANADLKAENMSLKAENAELRNLLNLNSAYMGG